MSIRNVSIIIPCYKATATLRRAAESALADAPQTLEILLVTTAAPMKPAHSVMNWQPGTRA